MCCMKKTTSSLKNWIASVLKLIISWLEHEDRSVHTQSKFVDLAPTDDADKAGVYSEALLFATNNPKVSNIALTGPYGSGKSSIIQSFLKKYRRPALHISLAAFVPEADSGGEEVSRQEIERSILQQMLYGADSNKLPFSRFKRIQSPGVGSIFKSLYIMIGILALWYVFHRREDIVSGTFFAPLALSTWFEIGILMLATSFLWVTLHHFYVASFGLSLKGISLKDIEIKPAHDDQASILNRHLDEIVYFFQSTDYDLVVIEDIDRFENAEIFVTLREINSLVNESAGVKRNIRFLYALRDDMFVNTDRTKFFEFIIPVIPIINTSNSIDMVLEQERRLKLDDRLERQFLREVSRYLNDLRLIQNIFNEYAIYVASLETDVENLLNANKLLAILIYKNVYPRDFEQLHRGTGILAAILNRQGELIAHGEAIFRTEIAKLENRLEVAEQQTPSNLRELRRIYAMALIEQLPLNVTSVSLDRRDWVAIANLVDDDVFEQLIEAPNLFHRSINSFPQQAQITKLQSPVDSHKSYLQRKEEIEIKAANKKSENLHQIRDLRSKIGALRTVKLNELLRLNSDHVQDLFADFGENGELARFLILEGHLDDTYYQYTSLFHSGRLSPNDNRFLIQIRAFVTPEPSFPIDNSNEVIAAMRDEDFRQSYVLNVKLVDSLLKHRSSYPKQSQKLLEFITSEFGSCEDFLDAYYMSGRDVSGLLLGLVKNWEGLVPTVIASSNAISHVSQLVSNLPEASLKALAKDFDELPEFVSENLPEILVHSPELEPECLVSLDFEIKDLAAIKDHSEIVRVMFEAGLFDLTIPNLEYIYQAILDERDLESLRERNFTAIRSTNNKILMNRIEKDFDDYLRNILLALRENSKEDAATILSVVRHDEVNQDDLREFLERQTAQLASLESVPERFHAVLFDQSVIEPTWENCLSFMDSEGFEAESLTGYLEREEVRTAISEHPIPEDTDSKQLRLFLFHAGTLSDAAYREYIQILPKPIQTIPEALEPTKIQILINERKVSFTQENFEWLADMGSLQVKFVAKNVEEYLSHPEKFEVDDGLREELLRSGVSNIAKLGIIELINLENLSEFPERAAIIGSILNETDGKIANLNGGVAQSLIIYSKLISTQISLFNKYQSLLAVDEVRHVLASLPKPFSEIKTGRNSPKLQNSLENKVLVKWLESRDIISSWSEGRFVTNDIKVNLYRS